MPRLAALRYAAMALAVIASAGSADARSGFCRARSSLPPGTYQKTCTCTVENCDYLVCTCDGTTHSATKITGCTSQSFSDVGGRLVCN